MHGGMMAGMELVNAGLGLLALTLLVLAVLGIVALVRHLSNPSAPGNQPGRQPDEAFPPRPPDRTPPWPQPARAAPARGTGPVYSCRYGRESRRPHAAGPVHARCIDAVAHPGAGDPTVGEAATAAVTRSSSPTRRVR